MDNEQEEEKLKDIFENIILNGTHYSKEYKQWLRYCFLIRNLNDLKGFTPIACYSKTKDGHLTHWLVCVKDGKYFVDINDNESPRHAGLHCKSFEEIKCPSHVYEWIINIAIPTYKNPI